MKELNKSQRLQVVQALIMQIGLTVVVYLCMFSTLKRCFSDTADTEQQQQKQKQNDTLSWALCGLCACVSAEFAVGVYLVLDMFSVLAVRLGFYLLNTAFDMATTPPN